MRTPNKLTEMTNSDFDSAIKKATLSVMRCRRILQPHEIDGKGKGIGVGIGIDEEKEENGCVYDDIYSEEKEERRDKGKRRDKDKERRIDNNVVAAVTPNSKQSNVQPVHLTPHTQHVRTSERASERTSERTGEYLHERTYSMDEETLDPKIPVRRSSMDENQKYEKEIKREKEKECAGSRSENSKNKGGKPAGSGLRTTSSSGCRGEKKEQSVSPPKLRKSASNFDLFDSSGW